MASKLYVTEYARGSMVQVGGALMQVPQEPPLAEQTIDYSGGHAESSAFNAQTTLVRIATDSICSIQFGTAPTATTSTQRMAAGGNQFHGVPKNQSFKVSAVINT